MYIYIYIYIYIYLSLNIYIYILYYRLIGYNTIIITDKVGSII